LKKQSGAKERRTESNPDLASTPATIRSTGGLGFDFEDQVGAWLLLKMLFGEPLPDMDNARGIRLQTQTSGLGWKIDDLLVTCQSGADVRKIAISCKSNLQVSGKGLPKGFIRPAWQQWFQADGPLNRDQDRVALVTRGTHTDFQESWTEVKRACTGDDPVLALGRIRKAPRQKKILDSIVAPLEPATGSASDEDLVRFIRHLLVIPTDFDTAPSKDEAAAIAVCRRLLVSGELEDGRNLWNTLIKATNKARLGNGTIELSSLWSVLREQFSLNDHPDFTGPWKTLRSITSDYVSALTLKLPNGFELPREPARIKLTQALTDGRIILLYGDSGAGKSALAKATLDTAFPEINQVWLGYESAEMASSETLQNAVGLTQPLLLTLDETSRRTNILVLDAVERFPGEVLRRLSPVTAALAKKPSDGSIPTWRILIITQTQALAEGLSLLLGGISAEHVELEPLLLDEVKAALWSTDHLRWIASERGTVEALTNLRALAWVMEAETQFQVANPEPFLSPTALADRLWRFWTNGNLALQSIMMRLGTRDADFEHSLPLSEMDTAEATALNSRPAQLPVRISTLNRISFQHDLAADWARFQRLKEIAFNPEKWAAYASNPLWTAALRMLGQFLLRERLGDRNAWDAVYHTLEHAEDPATKHAADVLLDALCLDPAAETFLGERVEFLLSNHAVRLNRLLRRFHHTATVAANDPGSFKLAVRLRIYVEASQRIPVVGRWPGVVRFLVANKDRIADLVSPAVAELCERWATTTPVKMTDGRAFPLRQELADLALATARALQVLKGNSRVMLLDDSEPKIYSAVFSAAEDRPDDIAAWALEMARRRPREATVASKIHAIRQTQAEEHKERMKTDAEYRTRHERKESGPIFIPSARKLPPWPLGPSGPVERHFRDLCSHSGALQPLMRARPDAAAEIILATTIEGSPEERYDNHRIDKSFGLQFSQESSPTIYWQSPFFAFLQINPEIALSTLKALVEFSTDRWEQDIKRHSGVDDLSNITLVLNESSTKTFIGGYELFEWSHVSSYYIGSLACALAGLEQWFYVSLDRGIDIAPYVDRILVSCRSSAFLGVLVDVGKRHHVLFESLLLPLLTSADLYFWDDARVKTLGFGFSDFEWIRKGEAVFDMARDWWFAPHRKVGLREVALQLVREHPAIAQSVSKAYSGWKVPADTKASLELRLLQADLNPANHKAFNNAKTGQTEYKVQYPDDLRQALEAYQESIVPASQALTLPNWCKKALLSQGTLPPEQAAALEPLLRDPAALGDDEDLADQRQLARLAVACVLLVKARSWTEQRPDTSRQAHEHILQALARVGETRPSIHDADLGRQGDELKLVAHVVLQGLLDHGPTPEITRRVMLLLTSPGLATFMALAFQRRDILGPIWPRLLHLSVLWAGLLILGPRYDTGPDLQQRWQHWLRWLRSRAIEVGTTDAGHVDLLTVAQRVERLERRRWMRQAARHDRFEHFDPSVRQSAGLNTAVLEAAFRWLLTKDSTYIGSLSANEAWGRCTQLLSLLSFEVWLHPIEDEDRDPLPTHFGYEVLDAIAWFVAGASNAHAKRLWHAIFRLQSKYHHFAGHFVRVFLGTVARDSNPDVFARRWESILKIALRRETWTKGQHWYRGAEILRHLLGFGSEPFLDTVAAYQFAVKRMQPLYDQWSKRFLKEDADNVAGLCQFLSSTTGKHLRRAGLVWIHRAIKDTEPRWRSDDGTADAVISFVSLVLTEDGSSLSQDQVARDALLAITARLVTLQIPSALTLQEQARTVLRKSGA
jgi:hypothetical protein